MPTTDSQAQFLLGTVGHNQHIGNIARSLHEANALGAYYTGGVDLFRSSGGRVLRKLASRVYPKLDAKLSRRQIPGVPSELIFPDWRWEGMRLAASYSGMGARKVDWVWEHGELALDRRCAGLIQDNRFGAYFGVEHGALASIQAAHASGKKAVVAFLSPHHTAYSEWVDAEYDRFPELLTPDVNRLRELAKSRDGRRDEEARTADVVHCASMVTAQSLIRAGLATMERLTIVPLGCPPVTPADGGDLRHAGVMRFIYSGNVSVGKGVHILLDAWKKLRPGRTAELHIYGAITLPKSALEPVDRSVVFHGPVTSVEIRQAYQNSDVLVFPTLRDGFGMVVAEAFAHGLPVITTPNAGAADLVEEGKNGFIIPARDAERLASSMQYCIDNPEELRAMRPAARRTAENWQWSDFRKTFRVQLAERMALDFLVAQ